MKTTRVILHAFSPNQLIKTLKEILTWSKRHPLCPLENSEISDNLMLFNLFFSNCIHPLLSDNFPNKKMSKSPRDFVTLTKRDCCLYKANPQLLITWLLAEKGNLVKSLNSMQWKRFRIAWEMGRVSGNFYIPPWPAQDPAIFAAGLSLWFFFYKCF